MPGSRCIWAFRSRTYRWHFLARPKWLLVERAVPQLSKRERPFAEDFVSGHVSLRYRFYCGNQLVHLRIPEQNGDQRGKRCRKDRLAAALVIGAGRPVRPAEPRRPEPCLSIFCNRFPPALQTLPGPLGRIAPTALSLPPANVQRGNAPPPRYGAAGSGRPTSLGRRPRPATPGPAWTISWKHRPVRQLLCHPGCSRGWFPWWKRRWKQLRRGGWAPCSFRPLRVTH